MQKLNNLLSKMQIFYKGGKALFEIFTHLTYEEKIKLFDLGRSLPKNAVIVEIGSYLGASSCFLAIGVKGRDGLVYAVDTWENIAMSEGPNDTYCKFRKNTEQLKDYIVPLRGLSAEIARQFDKTIDLLFIDGDHSYAGCYSDWIFWRPFLKKGSLVVFHDIGWAEGVKRVVSEEITPIVNNEGRLPNLYWARLK